MPPHYLETLPFLTTRNLECSFSTTRNVVVKRSLTSDHIAYDVVVVSLGFARVKLVVIT